MPHDGRINIDIPQLDNEINLTINGYYVFLSVLCGSRFFKFMKVIIPSALLSYTATSTVEAAGATVAALLDALEVRFPGIRFRMIDEQDAIRRHIRIFVNGNQVADIAHPLDANDEIVIVQALSGG